MPHHTSQPFLFASLPSSTSTPVTPSRKQSFGNVYSSSASIISSVGTIGSIASHNGGGSSHSFYNLSKDSNRSNVDLPLPPRHSPYPVLYSHANYSNLSISQHNTSGHSIYSSNSYASSCLSLASSQYSVSTDQVHHAFGSLPPPCPPRPASIFSASSSSLPLAASVNIPINTPTPTTTKSLSSSSSASLSSRRRSSPKLPYQQQQQQSSIVLPTPSHHASLSQNSSSTDLSLPHTPPQAPSPSLRTLLLPSAAAIGMLSPRKRISNTIPPLNTKALAQPATLSPSFLSSRSTNMSSISPSCESSVFGNTYSDASSAAGSTPSTPTHSRPFVSMAITELVISEAHYLTSINRIGNALSQAAETNPAAGRKESSTLRSVSDRWAELTRLHTKFHDNVVAVDEDLRETAGLLNGLLVTLEPILIDHSRDLSISLKKLSRRDQNSELTAAEWESALRQPLEHLSSYEEWLLHIDPQRKFCKDYHAHLQGLIYKTKMASDANPHPRNMLRRLGTMARDVIKRRSSVQLLTQGSSLSETTTPSTPTTPHSASTLDSEKPKASTCSPTTPNPITVMPDNTVMTLGIANNNDLRIDTVTTPASTTTSEMKSPLEKGLPKIPSHASSSQSQPSPPQESATTIADTFQAPLQVKKLHHCPSSTSELSSITTLTIPSSSLASSSTSVHSQNSSSSAETIVQVQIQEQVHLRSNTSNATLTRQKFLDDKEARKATLRVGTSEVIQARAQNLQSPSYNSGVSAESLRRVSPTKSEAEKPPVKSLISFWEQVNDPLEV